MNVRNDTFVLGFGQQVQPQQQQQQQQPVFANPNEALLTSVYRCNIFGDERDQIIGNWNLLQAFWGTGKGKHINRCRHSFLGRSNADMYRSCFRFLCAECYSVRIHTSEYFMWFKHCGV